MINTKDGASLNLTHPDTAGPTSAAAAAAAVDSLTPQAQPRSPSLSLASTSSLSTPTRTPASSFAAPSLEIANSPACTLRLQTSNLSLRSPRNPAAGMARSPSYSDNLSPGNESVTSPYSPAMGSLNHMTPLPSPRVGSESPGPWNKYPLSRQQSLNRSTVTPPRSFGSSVLVTASGESLDSAIAAHGQRKSLIGSRPGQTLFNNVDSKPDLDSLAVPIKRSLSKHGHERSPSLPVLDARLHREKYFGHRRRTFSSADSSPVISSAASVSSISSIDAPPSEQTRRLIKKQKLESFEATTVADNRHRRWRGIRLLGQGAFSKVFLATSEDIPEEVDRIHDEGVVVDEESLTLNPRKYVAVKIVEHGAAGADGAERVETGLKRELDILKSVNHPCLIRLKAFAIEPQRALLVLPYCAGGDLFDIASSMPLEAPLIRRMFAEIVSAVRYLHRNGIVHRDVKLENVLVNLTRPQLATIAAAPFDYPHSITTLTDVGLSRRVDFANDELLTTRCGSDDYASPELIMGMPYDGRQTDAWALGVLLYALLEERLPFDPPPGATDPKMRSKTAHRIARCEWKWVKHSEDAEGGNDPELEGGKKIVEGLLKRALKRWKVERIEEEDPWVKEAIQVHVTALEE